MHKNLVELAAEVTQSRYSDYTQKQKNEIASYVASLNPDDLDLEEFKAHDQLHSFIGDHWINSHVWEQAEEPEQLRPDRNYFDFNSEAVQQLKQSADNLMTSTLAYNQQRAEAFDLELPNKISVKIAIVYNGEEISLYDMEMG